MVKTGTPPNPPLSHSPSPTRTVSHKINPCLPGYLCAIHSVQDSNFFRLPEVIDQVLR